MRSRCWRVRSGNKTGRTPEIPPDANKFTMPVVPNSIYLFDSSSPELGRALLYHQARRCSGIFKGKAKKGPFKLEEFQEKFRYQLQDEHQAFNQAQDAASKQLERRNLIPKTCRRLPSTWDGLSPQTLSMTRTSLDLYQPDFYSLPTVYVLEERQIGQRTYPTRYVVTYQDQALRQPGYRLV